MRTVQVAAALVVASCVTLPVAAETLHIVLASPLVEEGSGPDGCTPALSGLGGPPVWQVRVERYLLDGKALIEASRVAEPSRFPLCIADRPVREECRVSNCPSSPMRAAARGPPASFCASPIRRTSMSWKPMRLPDAFGLLSVINGERREIAGRNASLAVGRAETLGVKAIDNHFRNHAQWQTAIRGDGRGPHFARPFWHLEPGRQRHQLRRLVHHHSGLNAL